MTKSFRVYDFVDKDADFGEYMDQQPRLMATFEKHAEVEAALFKKCGLMCACPRHLPVKDECDEPVTCTEPTTTDMRCATCNLPLYRLTVLAAEPGKGINNA